MCGRFDTSHLTWADVHEILSGVGRVRTEPINDLGPNDDVRPTDPQWVARLEGEDFVVDRMRWGLIPRSYKGRVKPSARGAKDGFQLTTFNCRSEPFTGEDPKTPWSYKFAFQERRCVAFASRWYEWTGPQGARVKHAFARADGRPVIFAGIWDTARTLDEGEVSSFTIMTGPSEGVLAEYHSRAPVVLEPNDLAAWLNPAVDAVPLLKAVRADRFLVKVAA